MAGWMRRAPRWVVVLVLVYVVVLVSVGVVSHVADLVQNGLRPYLWAPDWLNLFWSSLAVFDALAALLLLCGKRAGVDLTCAIMTADLAANWYAVHCILHSGFLAAPGLQRLAAFTAFVFVSGPCLRPRLGRLIAAAGPV
ncbi:hypothetical protein [Streptomyces sp. NPDC002785]|uniref:hypothetical protein n=1 Tax=Streptomyces sp. NPDC002785 TaxID=3154543 RepID=UPI00331F1B0A